MADIGQWVAFLSPESHALELEIKKKDLRGLAATAGEHLKANRTLEKLRLVENQLTPEDAQELAAGLKENTTLRKLAINYNQEMGAKGVEAIMAAVAGHPNLAEFHFGDQGLGPETASLVAGSLRNHPGLRVLDLSFGGEIGLEGAMALADLLRESRGLESLLLTENESIGSEGAKAIAGAIASNEASALKTLECNYNEMKDEGAIAMAEMLKSNRSLRKLGLHANKIQAAGVCAICEALTQNRGLEDIDLRHNQCGDEAAPALAEALRTSTVRIWDLRSMRLTGAGVAQLAPGAAVNIDLSGNDLGAAGLRAVAEWAGKVSADSALEELTAVDYGTAVPEDVELMVARSHQSNLKLKVLELAEFSGPLAPEAEALMVKALAAGSAMASLQLADASEHLEQLVKALTSSQLAKLSCRFLDLAVMQNFLSALPSFSFLSVLELQGTLTGAGPILKEALLLNASLNELTLSKCELNAEDARLISEGLAGNSWLKSLDLSENGLAEGLESIFAANKGLEKLDVTNTGMGDDALAALAGSLNSKRLTTLRISGAGEAAAFADALQRNVVLRELEWKDALLEGSGASLAKALETNSFLGSFLLEQRPKKSKTKKAWRREVDEEFESAMQSIAWLTTRNSQPPLLLHSNFAQGESCKAILTTLAGKTMLELDIPSTASPKDLLRQVFDRLGYVRPLRLVLPDGRFWQEEDRPVADLAGSIGHD
ncbi:unnamed protein product [Effrenium voratum]|nr:unnamed protein product [Effrenium voratum]